MMQSLKAARRPLHLLDLSDIQPNVARWLVDEAFVYKKQFFAGGRRNSLQGKRFGLLLERPATRTRLHFEVVARDLGAESIILPFNELMASRGEPPADTARVLSRHLDLIMYRAASHSVLLDFAAHSQAPVINGMSDKSHPFRTLVEIMTFEEQRGPIAGKRIVVIGNCNQNSLNSWIHAAAQFHFTLVISHPEGQRFAAAKDFISWARAQGGDVRIESDPVRAVAGADFIITDTWAPVAQGDSVDVSMLRPYQVNQALMDQANPGALFVHPLPAYRGREVTAEVIDGPQSVTWAGGIENKRFLLVPLYEWLLGVNGPADTRYEQTAAIGDGAIAEAV
jgi:ornithine carbamoyltransferase